MGLTVAKRTLMASFRCIVRRSGSVGHRPRSPLARPDGRVGSSLRELRAFVLAFARSYG